MAKFYGKIGYAGASIETSPGIWEPEITELDYAGDVIKDVRQSRSGENINDNLTISNVISIVADPFAYANFHTMRYVKWMGASWKITNIDVQRPRLILTIGGIYNG